MIVDTIKGTSWNILANSKHPHPLLNPVWQQKVLPLIAPVPKGQQAVSYHRSLRENTIHSSNSARHSQDTYWHGCLPITVSCDGLDCLQVPTWLATDRGGVKALSQTIYTKLVGLPFTGDHFGVYPSCILNLHWVLLTLQALWQEGISGVVITWCQCSHRPLI